PPPRGAAALAEGLRQGRRTTISWAKAFVRLAFSLAFFGATLVLVRMAAPRLGAPRGDTPARRGSVARLIARDQVARLESALELYRTEHGEYPAVLRALVEGQLVTEQDLRYPWKEPYYYRRTQQGFVLLPPLD
ncbi:MAG TPA: type II secretion system protein GspG, partial [Myxococcales bacterium]